VEKNKLEDSLANLRKAHGEMIVLRLTDRKFIERPRISCGSFGLDRALGGGFVKGSLNEVFGPESSGKTTLCISAVAEAQKIGNALFVDVEHSFDPVYARNLGVDIDKLLFSQPEYAEQAFDVVEHMVGSGALELVVVDSIPALLPEAELRGDPGDKHMGLAARLNRQHLRRILPAAKKTGTTILYVNQITYKIGVPSFMNPETTGGGTGFKYFCSTRTDIRKISTQKDSLAKESIRARARVVKNKTYVPFQSAEFDIRFGKGVDVVGEIFDFAVEQGVVEKSGAWYSYGKDRLGQGRENAVQALSKPDNDWLNLIRDNIEAIEV